MQIYLICTFMNINENIRNGRKKHRKIKLCYYKITYILAAYFSSLPKWVLN